MQNDIMYEIENKKKWIHKSISLYLVIVFVLIALAGGFALGKNYGNIKVVSSERVEKDGKEYGKVLNKEQVTPDYLSSDANFGLFWDVWNKIQNKYIDKPVGETSLLYGALSGLVSALDDPYSIFLPPEPAKEFQDDLKGKFEGIGAEIGVRNNLLTIISPLTDSPAEKAGLRAKDRVVEIDGTTTENMSLNQAVSLIRGDKGSTVVLKVYRESDNLFHEIPIVRDTIHVVSVEWEIKQDNIAYIKITNFNSDTNSRFRQAVNEVLLKNPKGIILDLRNNPGGYLDRAVDIASFWLPAGKVVVQEEFADKQNTQQYLASGKAELKDYMTIVLVNGGSASASEIVAGALRDHGKAKLIGEKTFGKGSVQSLEELAGGSAIKITVARWLTPNGNQIDVVGLEPDEVVELTVEDYQNEKDPQLDKAIELMNNE
ncbi:S41 family peptidase [Patescibacteria group bacterium]